LETGSARVSRAVFGVPAEDPLPACEASFVNNAAAPVCKVVSREDAGHSARDARATHSDFGFNSCFVIRHLCFVIVFLAERAVVK
jgi:hypothetical protein